MAASGLLSSPSLVSICDKSFIKPSTLTPSTLRLHKLSFVDQSVSNMYIPVALFYPKPQREESNNSNLSHIADLLQTSLSQTLVSYYPYAGILRDNATAECNDMGAEFLSVKINCPMSEILNHPHATDAESIVFPKDLPWKNNYEGGNLLVVQLSKFDCGGIAISACLSHKIGDGCSVINFLNHWANVTRDRRFVVPSPRFVGDSILSSTSLSQTLVSYYPYAGILRDNATVECNDMGAEFLSVKINCPMSEILNHPHATDAESIVFPKDLPWKNNYEG
uniref:Acylsugar acyltransferase 3-like n=1 Tax=Nicotiana tabacum TaxID=4097 RepID=A0A1S4ASY0_TOBAC